MMMFCITACFVGALPRGSPRRRDGAAELPGIRITVTGVVGFVCRLAGAVLMIDGFLAWAMRRSVAVTAMTTMVVATTMAAVMTAGGMCVIVQMFVFGGFAVLTAIAFEQAAARWFPFGDTQIENAENLRLESEAFAERKGDLRILALQPFDLCGDAFDQHAGE